MTAWERFWWAKGSRRALGLLRLCFGAALLFKMLGLTGLHRWGAWSIEVPFHHTGYMFVADPDGFHLPLVPGLPALSEAVWWRCEQLALLAAAMLTLGIATRLAAAMLLAFFAYPLLYSWFDYYHHLFHIVAVLPILAVARCDEHWSVPALLRRAAPPPRPVLPLRLLQVWTTWIYLSAFVGKTSAEWLGGAVLAAVIDVGHIHGELAAAVLRIVSPAALAQVTWALQGLVPLGLWHPRTRPFAVAAGVLLHLGIDSMMHVESFSLQMLALYLAFLGPGPESSPHDVHPAGPARLA